MPKQKTNKACKKRLKVTAKGKIKHFREGRGHLLSKKSAKRKRRLRTPKLVNSINVKRAIRLLSS